MTVSFGMGLIRMTRNKLGIERYLVGQRESLMVWRFCKRRILRLVVKFDRGKNSDNYLPPAAKAKDRVSTTKRKKKRTMMTTTTKANPSPVPEKDRILHNAHPLMIIPAQGKVEGRDEGTAPSRHLGEGGADHVNTILMISITRTVVS
jgi:hypothetical protein